MFKRHIEKDLRLQLLLSKDCLATIDQDIFWHQDVVQYIQHCVSAVTVHRHIQVFPNQMPWFCLGNQGVSQGFWINKEVKEQLRKKNQIQKQGLVQLRPSLCEERRQRGQGEQQAKN